MKLQNSKIFVPATILYAMLIFYLSVTSNLGNIEYFLNITFGQAIVKFLITNNLSFVLDLLISSFNFAERQSLDTGHVGVYFGFGILLFFLFESSRNQMLKKHSAVFAIFLGTAYGALNETFQLYLPYRTASITDALSNLLGLVLAQIFVITFISILRHIQKRNITKG